MTINTQVHLNDSPKPTTTICQNGEAKSKGNVQTKKRKTSKAQRDKTQAARRELATLTKQLKEEQKNQASQAATDIEATTILAMKPNELLKAYYLRSPEATELKTFRQWKDDGYSVKKHQTSLRVWGKPFKSQSEKTIATEQGKQTVSTEFDLYPMVPLFSNIQVEKAGSTEETPLNATNRITTATRSNKITAPQHALERIQKSDTQKISFVDPKTLPSNDVLIVQNTKLATRLRGLAERLQSDIDHAFANRHENTPKRIAQAACTRQKGQRLQRTQQALHALAGLHDSGKVPKELKEIKSKKAVYDLLALHQESVSNGYHTYHIETNEPVDNSDEAKALWSLIDDTTKEHQAREAYRHKLNHVKFAKISGYFPTPTNVINRMCELADIQAGHLILEPEAGTGAILDYLDERYQDIETVGYEIHSDLYDIVSTNHKNIQHTDFLNVTPKPIADRILMNPPFEHLQDIEHIQHAYGFLKPGGRLVAIMSPSAFFRKDRMAANAFRGWFSDCNGYEEDLPGSSFKASGTNVNTKLVTLDKPQSSVSDNGGTRY